MSYEPVGLVPRWRINELTEIARTQIPEQSNGSFIVYFPEREVPMQWFPNPQTIPLETRLIGLLPSQQVARHSDAPGTPAFVRYHVCLRTNDQCWSFSEDHWTRLHEGMIYRMDPSQPHGAVNWGTTLRLHLMIDVEA
jgi:hypothetical protein